MRQEWRDVKTTRRTLRVGVGEVLAEVRVDLPGGALWLDVAEARQLAEALLGKANLVESRTKGEQS